MNISDLQVLLSTAGLYRGGIDGDPGPKTMTAVNTVLGALGGGWPDSRKATGAAQTLLNDLGFEAGVVDGYAGHNTNNALEQWRYLQIHGKREVVKREPLPSRSTVAGLPRQHDVEVFYGAPGPEIERQLTYANLPFGLRLDWDLGQSVTRFRVHEKCAPSLESAMIDVREHYGEGGMANLGIDRYAGGYMHRKMRGGSKWSMHAYGCAVDFYAQPNGLRARCPKALFCASDYKPFLDIMESHGWLPAVRLWGADAMHFQRAQL